MRSTMRLCVLLIIGAFFGAGCVSDRREEGAQAPAPSEATTSTEAAKSRVVNAFILDVVDSDSTAFGIEPNATKIIELNFELTPKGPIVSWSSDGEKLAGDIIKVPFRMKPKIKIEFSKTSTKDAMIEGVFWKHYPEIGGMPDEYWNTTQFLPKRDITLTLKDEKAPAEGGWSFGLLIQARNRRWVADPIIVDDPPDQNK